MQPTNQCLEGSSGELKRRGRNRNDVRAVKTKAAKEAELQWQLVGIVYRCSSHNYVFVFCIVVVVGFVLIAVVCWLGTRCPIVFAKRQVQGFAILSMYELTAVMSARMSYSRGSLLYT